MKTVKLLQHLCYTSHNEVLCREEEDFIALTNSWAVASFHNDTEILVDSLMSTHCHFLVFTAQAPEFIQRGRHSYAAYFNRKYSRQDFAMVCIIVKAYWKDFTLADVETFLNSR